MDKFSNLDWGTVTYSPESSPLTLNELVFYTGGSVTCLGSPLHHCLMPSDRGLHFKSMEYGDFWNTYKSISSLLYGTLFNSYS